MRPRPHFFSLLLLAAALAASWVLSAAGQPMAPDAGERGDGGDAAACAGGVVLDDGSAETGYGWVPSVIEGEYVQEFDAASFTSRRLDSVCICWLRTRQDSEIDFEIVLYRQVPGSQDGDRPMPAAEPYAAFPATAEVTPMGIEESFFEVDVGGVMMPPGRSYVGARWDAARDQFFFVCTDTSEGTAPVEVFFRDDRAEGEWTSVFESNDPIFRDHRAIMVRALPGPAVAVDVPALGATGLGLLATTLAAMALAALAGRRRSPERG